MALPRLRISDQTELSSTPGSVVVTDAANKQYYLVPGSNGQVLTIASGVPAWSSSAGSSFTISDNTTTQSIASGDTLKFLTGNGLTAVVSATDTVTHTAKLSTDSGNDITFGTDGGLYLSKDALVTGASWSDATNTLTLTFDGGTTVDVSITDTASVFLADFVISDGTTTDTVNNHETVTFNGDTMIKATVSANAVKYEIDNTGSSSGQVITTDGTTDSWGYAKERQARNEFTPASGGNTVTLTNTPIARPSSTVVRSVALYLNGMLVPSTEYTIVGTTVTFTSYTFGSSTGGAGTDTIEAIYIY